MEFRLCDALPAVSHSSLLRSPLGTWAPPVVRGSRVDGAARFPSLHAAPHGSSLHSRLAPEEGRGDTLFLGSLAPARSMRPRGGGDMENTCHSRCAQSAHRTDVTASATTNASGKPISTAYAGGRPTSSTHAGDRPTSSTYPGDRPISTVQAGDMPTSSTHAGGRSTPTAQTCGRPTSSTYAGGRPIFTAHSGGRPTSSAHAGGRSNGTIFPRPSFQQSVAINKSIMASDSVDELAAVIESHEAVLNQFNVATATSRLAKLVRQSSSGAQQHRQQHSQSSSTGSSNLISTLSSAALRVAPTFAPQQVAMLLTSYAWLNYQPPVPLLDALCTVAELGMKMGALEAEDASHILWAASRMDHHHAGLTAAVCRHACSHGWLLAAAQGRESVGIKGSNCSASTSAGTTVANNINCSGSSSSSSSNNKTTAAATSTSTSRVDDGIGIRRSGSGMQQSGRDGGVGTQRSGGSRVSSSHGGASTPQLPPHSLSNLLWMLSRAPPEISAAAEASAFILAAVSPAGLLADEVVLHTFGSQDLSTTISSLARLVRGSRKREVVSHNTLPPPASPNHPLHSPLSADSATLSHSSAHVSSSLHSSASAPVPFNSSSAVRGHYVPAATVDALCTACMHRLGTPGGGFGPQACANVCWALAQLGYRQDTLQRQICTVVMSQPSSFKPQEMSNIMVSLATLGVQPPAGMLPIVSAYIRRNVDRLNPIDVAELLYAFAKLGAAVGDGVTSGLRHVGDSEADLEASVSQSIPLLASQAASHPASTDPSTIAFAGGQSTGVGQRAGGDMSSSSKSSSSRDERGAVSMDMGSRNRGRADDVPDAVHLLLAERVRMHLAAFEPQQVVTAMWSLARLGSIPEPLLSAVLKALNAGCSQSFSNVYNGYEAAHVAPADVALMEGRVPISESISGTGSGSEAGSAMLMLSDLDPEELARLAWSLAVVGAPVSERLLRSFTDETMEWNGEMADQSLSMLMWALATLSGSRHPCPAFTEAASIMVLSRLQALSVQHLVVTMWSLSKLVQGCNNELHGMAHLDLFHSAPTRLLHLFGVTNSGRAHPRGVGQGAATPPVSASMRDISMLASAYATVEVRPDVRLLQWMGATIIRHAALHRLEPRSLSVLSTSFPHFNYESPELYELFAMGTETCLAASMAFTAAQQARLPMAAAAAAEYAAGHTRHALFDIGSRVTRPHTAPISSSAGSHPHRPPPQVQWPDEAQGHSIHQGGTHGQHPAPAHISASFIACQATALIKLHAYRHSTFDAIAAASLCHINSFSAVEAAQVIWALGACAHNCHPATLQALAAVVRTHLMETHQVIQDGSGSASPSAAAAAAAPSSAASLSASSPASSALPAAAVTGPGSKHLSEELVSMFLMGCANLRYHPGDAVLEACSAFLVPRAGSLSCHTLSEVVASLAELQHHGTAGRSLLSAVVAVVTERVLTRKQEVLTLGAMVNLLWGLSYYGKETGIQGCVRSASRRKGGKEAKGCTGSAGSTQKGKKTKGCAGSAGSTQRGKKAKECAGSARSTQGVKAANGCTKRASSTQGLRLRRLGRSLHLRRPPNTALLASPTLNKSPLFARLATGALSSSPDALVSRPRLLLRLIEAKQLLEAERRRGFWRSLKRRWDVRVKAGGSNTVPRPQLLQLSRARREDVSMEATAQRQISTALKQLGVGWPAWRTLPQGDEVCVFEAERDWVLEAVELLGLDDDDDEERGGGWVGARAAERTEGGRRGSRADGGSGAVSASSAIRTWAPATVRVKLEAGGGKGGVESLSLNAHSPAVSRLPAPHHSLATSKTLTPPVDRASARCMDGGGTGHSHEDAACTVSSSECTNSSPAGQGESRTQSKKRDKKKISRVPKYVLYLVSGWHLSVDVSQRQLASAAIGQRVLRSHGSTLLVVLAKSWIQMTPVQQLSALHKAILNPDATR